MKREFIIQQSSHKFRQQKWRVLLDLGISSGIIIKDELGI